MAVLQRSEFALALNQIASERGVDPQVVLETMKGAILAAYRKDNPIPDEEVELYSAALDENTGETKVLKEGKDVTPPGFGRIAAQTAKQVLLQKIREKEKDATIAEYSKRIGTVVNGMILRFLGPAIVVDIGKAEALIEPSEKIANEQYFLNKKMPVYIMGIDDEKREIMVSRSSNGLIEGLLRREVPEVASGSVVIKKIVREPGNRAKIAVFSDQAGIDPVGSCVGQKGVRIQAVIDALDGLEKIDVIQWSADPAKYITNALSPAKNMTVVLDEKGKTAHVKAPREELPLIIGREGQNVRLASKLTEYVIEVEGEEAPLVVEKPVVAIVAEEKTEKAVEEHVVAPVDVAGETTPVAEAPNEEHVEMAAADLVETPKTEEKTEVAEKGTSEKEVKSESDVQDATAALAAPSSDEPKKEEVKAEEAPSEEVKTE